MSLSNKTALVTGASSGIGRAVSTQLIEAGAKVIGLCRDTSKLPEGVEPIACDLSDPAQIDKAFASLSHLDILVSNAGLALLSRISDGNPADWETMWQLNVQALTICCQKSLPSVSSIWRPDHQHLQHERPSCATHWWLLLAHQVCRARH